MFEIPTLRTTHLTLRPIVLSDAEALFRVYQTEGVLRYFPDPTPPPIEKVKRFISNQKTHWEQYGYGNWGIVRDGEKEIIGWAGLQFLPETGETEVGYLLNRPYWGKGYATEAACLSIEFGFKKLPLD